MLWEEVRKDFFENPEEEALSELLVNKAPWEVLKILKSYLYDTLPALPKTFPLGVPLPQSYFLSTEGELIPLRDLEIGENSYVYKGREVKGAVIMAGAFFKGRRFFFGEGVVIEPFAYLEEPAYFSSGSQVRHAAYVRGSVYLGKGAIIGHTTEVKNSILFKEAKAAHFAYIGDSILGAYVNLGAGTKLANLKFLKKEITLQINGQIIHTGLRKMGAILGDRVQTGCNSVIQPGTLLGKDSIVYPGVSAGSGYFAPRSKIKT